MKRRIVAIAVVFAVLIVIGELDTTRCSAAGPQLINYQGKLTDDLGNPLSGNYDMTFKLWDNETSTDPSHLKWTETWNIGTSQVTVTDGLFNVILGSINTGSLHDVFKADDTLYMEVTVGTEKLSPRVRMGSAGYALRADTIQGSSSTDNLFPSSGNAGIGTTSPGEKLEVDGNIKLSGVVTESLPKTGQTTSHRSGDDGSYQKGAQVLVDNGDGTVTDSRTGLMWPKDGTGAGYNSGVVKTWTPAIDWAEALNFAGHTDWRLPNINELKSFQEVTWGHYQNQPTVQYWSSTTCANGTSSALYIHFSSGGHSGYDKAGNYYVVAVRGPD